MTTISIQLSEPLENFVADQVSAGGFQDASDYLLDLLHQAQARSTLEEKLLAGVTSQDRGEGREMTGADWERLRNSSCKP
ncbi:MAG: type II toxin-antitoxin system ParD family antitoxin [Planctomycetia bacterium]|nr:type II toxin-antitoxin system ParD family antitoxin [Planctomycetia bacterium]